MNQFQTSHGHSIDNFVYGLYIGYTFCLFHTVLVLYYLNFFGKRELFIERVNNNNNHVQSCPVVDSSKNSQSEPTPSDSKLESSINDIGEQSSEVGKNEWIISTPSSDKIKLIPSVDSIEAISAWDNRNSPSSRYMTMKDLESMNEKALNDRIRDGSSYINLSRKSTTTPLYSYAYDEAKLKMVENSRMNCNNKGPTTTCDFVLEETLKNTLKNFHEINPGLSLII